MAPLVYFSFPAHGHINPTLPVVRELVRRGQDVVYFSTAQFRQTIANTGAEFREYCPQLRMPIQGPGPFGRVSTTVETLLDFSCAVLEYHLDEVRELRPTHIAHDSFAPWGRFVAQLLQLPTIVSNPSILINPEIDARYGPKTQAPDPRMTPAWYAELQSRCHASLLPYKLPERPTPEQLLQTYGDLNLVYTSREFQPFAETFDETHFQFVGPCFNPCPNGCDLPDTRPLVYISFGTVYGNQPQFFQTCMNELADAPWQVVMATGGSLPTADVPPNFDVRASVPQIEILRRAVVFITHAGMNSVQEALYHGVPMVTAPQAADQFWISARTAELGAGLMLDQDEPGSIRKAVSTILSDSSYAVAAGRMGQTLRQAG